MRSVCVNDCYQDKMRQICKVDHDIFMSNTLIRKDYLINGNNRLLSCYNQYFNQHSYPIKQFCDKTCKVEYNNKYYPSEIKRCEECNTLFNFDLIHSKYPDIFVKHIPEMNLIGFLCNFGGLLGMWLGQSMCAILIEIFMFVKNVPFRNYLNIVSLNLNRLIHVHFNFALLRRFYRKLNKRGKIGIINS